MLKSILQCELLLYTDNPRSATIHPCSIKARLSAARNFPHHVERHIKQISSERVQCTKAARCGGEPDGGAPESIGQRPYQVREPMAVYLA